MTLLEARISELLDAVADATPIADAPPPIVARRDDRWLAGHDRPGVLELVPEGAERARRADGRQPARRRPHRILAGVAAALLVAAGAAGIDAVRAGPTTTVAPATALDPSVVPRIVLPGWTTSSYQEVPSNDDGSLRWVLVLRAPAAGLGGPVVRIGTARPPSGYGVGADAQPVTIGAVTGSFAVRGDDVAVTWEPTPGRTTFVSASGVAVDDVLGIARGLRVDAGQVPVGADVVPAPLQATPLAPLPATSTYGEYHFARAEQDLQVGFYAGGPSMFELRSADDDRRAVAVLGTTGLLLDYGDGRYRVDVQLGPWTWEADGTGYADAQQFLAVVERLQVVDEASWLASLPSDTGTGPTADPTGNPPVAVSEAVPGAGMSTTASTAEPPAKG